MSTTSPDTDDVDFNVRSLIGPAGAGANGAKLVQWLDDQFSPRMQALMERAPNQALRDKVLKDRKGSFAQVARIAGVEPRDILDVNVRGGELDDDDAYVTYVARDPDGHSTYKGGFPYNDLGESSSDGHVSHRSLSNASPVAAEQARAERKAGDANAPAPPASSGDPIADYEELKASDVIAYLEEHPERAGTVKALEQALRGDDARKTILNWEPKPSGD